MNYYKRHLGDYARDTGHLSALEHGIYCLLLDYYYSSEKPIPKDRAHRIARANPDETQMVCEEFFISDGDTWRHQRADREIAEYNLKADKNRENGTKGGRPASQTKPKRNPFGFRSQTQTEPSGNLSHKPLAISQEPIKEKNTRSRAISLPADFKVSERVSAWAQENGFTNLGKHLEYFTGYARANGKTYTDWDQALMNAIRGNWAKLPITQTMSRQDEGVTILKRGEL